MVHRLMYTAQYRENSKAVVQNFWCRYDAELPDAVTTMSVFCWEPRLFLYYECTETVPNPEWFLDGLNVFLEKWPGEEKPRFWIPMYDIFHYHRPVSAEQWRRKGKTRPWAQIARLKPETLSRYIYYHYQYQEEIPGDGDKYGVIGLHENLEFFYLEEPETIERPGYQGTLSTKLRPRNWDEVMEPHFLPWDDLPQEQYWRRIKLLFHKEGK